MSFLFIKLEKFLPRQVDLCCRPRAQTTDFLNNKNGKSGKHSVNEIVVNEVNCKIGAISFCVVFVRPFPMAVTGNRLAGEQANFTGLMVLLN